MEDEYPAYTAFLKAKVKLAELWGFECTELEVNPALKPHQRAAVVWNVRGGRRADFLSFGLGKSVIQLETQRLVLSRTGGRGLIVLPLGVRFEFVRDAREVLGWSEAELPRFIQSIEEASDTGIYLTNYQTVRDGKLDPAEFTVVSLDEAAILRGFGGSKTFRELMRLCTGDGGPSGNHRTDGKRVAYRFVATATPSPNEYIELLAYAEFLGIMDVSQAKAQPLDAKILTPTGWRLMGDIRVGDNVIAGDGSPTRVLGIYPQGERPIYRVTFSDGASTECDADHLWLTHTQYERNNERRYLKRTRKPGDWRARSSAQFSTVKTTAQIAATIRGPQGACNHSVPIVGPVVMEAKPYAVEPWLLGALLGDACLRDSSITFSTMDDWMRERVRLALPPGFTLRVTSRGECDFGITGTGRKGGRGPGSNPLLGALRGYGLLGKRSWEKHVPEDYLNNSAAVRLWTLRGLMDTDGTYDRANGASFTSTSAQLAADVVTLVRSLGGVATITKKRTPGRPAYFVRVTMPKDLNPFSLPRKADKWRAQKTGPMRYIVSVEPIGTKLAQCIAIEHPSRLYVTDDFAVTHNTRFFKRDSTKADNLTLHPHKEREFWLWVASWALFVQRPSDLGFSDEGYELPGMDVHWHEVPTDHSAAGHERSGQAKMFRDAAIGVQDAAAEKRISLPIRMAKLMDLRAIDPAAHRILWHDLEAEREAIEDALPIRRFEMWEEYRDGHPDGLALYERHYSAHVYADGRERKLFCGPGEKLVLLTANRDALFVWRKFVDDSGQTGINCAVFRNEGRALASDLIKEAMVIAWLRWPGSRLYTYVNAEQVRSSNPGCCFKLAGWKRCGVTKGGLLIFEALPGAAVPAVEPKPGIVTVRGNDTDRHKEDSIIGFSNGAFPEIAGKPSMLGCGVNWQRHCAWAIYLGIGFKFAEFIQSVHRIMRFLQTRRVRIDLIYTEAEREVRRQLERKWRQHNLMVEKMTEIIREFGLSHAAMAQTLTRKLGVERIETTGPELSPGAGPCYRLVHNDCVLELRRMRTASAGLVLTSIPFSSQYEYSPNYADFGHSEGNAEFFGQMEYMTPEMFRVLQPGRVAAIHVKDRIVPMGMTGLGSPTVYPFHAECIRHYTRHGFAYMGMKTIVTDVVRENNQTYRLGWTEQCKDGSKMGVGMPEYLLLFRKPPTERGNSYADTPVVKRKPLVVDPERGPVPFGDGLKAGEKEKRPIIPGSGYSRARWQVDAHGFARSNGNRMLTPEEMRELPHERIFKLFRQYSLSQVYDFEHHVRIGEALEVTGKLPSDFMLLQPQSWSDEVWTDITRMLTLNSTQSAKGKEMHLCPMQFDLADRVIAQFSMPGETVLDPFGGLMTVPYRAMKLRRVGVGIELNPAYFADGAQYCRAAAEEMAMPTLFDLAQFEEPAGRASEEDAA